jgi:hypothetical protein
MMLLSTAPGLELGSLRNQRIPAPVAMAIATPRSKTTRPCRRAPLTPRFHRLDLGRQLVVDSTLCGPKCCDGLASGMTTIA